MLSSMDNEEVPYRTPVDIGQAKQVSSQDEDDFSTLIFIQKEINREVQKLSDVDAFDLAEAELSVKEQLAAYRKAREILEPIQQTINSTIDEIKLKQKEGK